MKTPQNSGPVQIVKLFGIKLVCHTCTFSLVSGLIVAWLITDVFLQVGQYFAARAEWHRQHRANAAQAVQKNLKMVWILVLLVACTCQALADMAGTNSAAGDWPRLDSPKPEIWSAGVGNGFNAGVRSFGLNLGAGAGVQMFGGREEHDLALLTLSYGYMLAPVLGDGHWWRGNPELRGELFAGAQFSPSTESIVGLAPHVRYNFATGTRWVPYVDAGAGVTATSIGPPDLSGTFEFNLSAATGLRWFICPNVALGVEVRYLHVSCAGLHDPNLGLNNVGGSLGATWFF